MPRTTPSLKSAARASGWRSCPGGLTEGVTRDWHIPYRILDLPNEDLNRLPELLRNIPEEQARVLCAVLGENLRQFDYWDWTEDAFRPLLEEFGPWLDA